MNRHEKRKLEALGSGEYKSRHRGSKKGYHKGCFGSPGIDVPKRETGKGGRGNIDTEAIEKTKECLRSHPEGVTAVQVAEATGTSQARAARLLDLLSGNSDDNTFLIYTEEVYGQTKYFIFKDGGEK